jgi:hypothetical protein
MRFTLRRLMICVTLVACGLGTFSFIRTPDPIATGAASIIVWIVGGMIIGAGMFSLYKRPVIGAMAGSVFGLMVQSAIVFFSKH